MFPPTCQTCIMCLWTNCTLRQHQPTCNYVTIKMVKSVVETCIWMVLGDSGEGCYIEEGRVWGRSIRGEWMLLRGGWRLWYQNKINVDIHLSLESTTSPIPGFTCLGNHTDKLQYCSYYFVSLELNLALESPPNWLLFICIRLSIIKSCGTRTSGGSASCHTSWRVGASMCLLSEPACAGVL